MSPVRERLLYHQEILVFGEEPATFQDRVLAIRKIFVGCIPVGMMFASQLAPLVGLLSKSGENGRASVCPLFPI
jgi:hypothetical protein